MMSSLIFVVDVAMCSSSKIGSPTLSGSISTPLGRTRNCLWQLLVETLVDDAVPLLMLCP